MTFARTFAMLLAPMLVMGAVTETQAAPRRAPAHQASARQPAQPAPGPRGEVFLNGHWVSDAWCDATVPGPNGGPAGPGRGLCDASTPRR